MKPSLVVFGLGNPGKSYAATRHNAGFMALDAFAAAFGQGEWQDRQKFHAVVCEARIVAVPVLLVKPQTYMNRSGECVRKVIDFYKLDPAAHILVCSDDIDLPLGTVRLRMSGGPGTHNGLKSVVEQLGEKFARLRIGIGPSPADQDLSAWVLSTFGPEEQSMLDDTLKKLPKMLSEFVLGRGGGEMSSC